jgi:hypothetical protein
MGCTGGCGPGCGGGDETPIQVGSGAPKRIATSAQFPGHAGIAILPERVRAYSITQATGRLTPFSFPPERVPVFEGGSEPSDQLAVIMGPALSEVIEGPLSSSTVHNSPGKEVTVKDGSWIQSGGSMGFINLCFQPHSRGDGCPGPNPSCIDHQGSRLVSTAWWKFFASIADPPKGMYIRSDIEVMVSIYDCMDTLVRQFTRQVPPEYWGMDAKGVARFPDAHRYPHAFDPYVKCRMDVSCTDKLRLVTLKLTDPDAIVPFSSGAMIGPGGKTTGDAGGRKFMPPDSDKWVDPFTGYQWDKGEITETEVPGYSATLEYHMTTPHCSPCEDLLARNPRVGRIAPVTGGGTPTPPPSGSGGVPTPAASRPDGILRIAYSGVREFHLPRADRAWSARERRME